MRSRATPCSGIDSGRPDGLGVRAVQRQPGGCGEHHRRQRVLYPARASQWRQHVDPTQTTNPYAFEGGYPTPETIQKADDDADLNGAAQDAR
jgi:hypothetical protein